MNNNTDKATDLDWVTFTEDTHEELCELRIPNCEAVALWRFIYNLHGDTCAKDNWLHCDAHARAMLKEAVTGYIGCEKHGVVYTLMDIVPTGGL